MGWSIGFDGNWNRDIGYGVPAICDHPDCNEEINRGLSYVCHENEPFGGEGCGLYFCEKHREPIFSEADECIGRGCERCAKGEAPFAPKPDVPRWVEWKLTDASWQRWRKENPESVEALRASQRRLTE
jgi:hypothetical protein